MITTAAEALEVLELVSVEFDELSVRKLLGHGQSPSDDGQYDLDLAMQFREDTNRLSYRLRAQMSNASAEVLVIVAGHFESQNQLEIAPEGIADFANTVAFEILLPYVREAIGSMLNRIGVSGILPIFHAGSVSFDLDD